MFTLLVIILFILDIIYWRKIYDYLRNRNYYDDLYLFTSNLLEMIKINLPLDQSIEQIYLDSFSPLSYRFSRLRRALKGVMLSVRKGSSLSEAMEKERRAFPEYYINLIRIGEKEENLLPALDTLKGYLKVKKDYTVTFTRSFSYLITLIAITASVAFFLVTYIMPTFIDLFEGMDLSLPLPTKFLIGIVKACRNPFIFIPLILIIIGIIRLTLPFKKFAAWLSLKLPVIKYFVRNQEYMIFCRVMSGLLNGWLPPDRALSLASEVSSNRIYSDVLKGSAEKFDSGITETLRKTGLFDKTFLFMTSLGEKTENPAEIFREMSNYYEFDYIVRLKQSFTFLEVITIASVGVAAGFIAISCFLPIYQLIGNIAGNVLY